MIKSIKKFFGFLFSLVLIGSSATSLTSCSGSNDINFAFFDGYLSETVQKGISQKYGKVIFTKYASNDSIPTYLKNYTYDIAIATQYKIVEMVREGLLLKLDWSKFNLYDHNDKLITHYSELKPYFTDIVWDMCMAYDVNEDGVINEDDNLLNWTVPYFAQTLGFAYRTNVNDHIKNWENNNNIEFKDIFDDLVNDKSQANNILIKKSNNQGLIIKDNMTVLDLAKYSQGIYDLSFSNDPNQNSIKAFTDTYNILNNKLKPISNKILFNDNSNSILNIIAENSAPFAILYNGDAIFAALGGDNAEPIELDQYNKDGTISYTGDFHYISPKNSLVCFDGLVINNRYENKEIEHIYSMISNLVFGNNESSKLFNANSKQIYAEFIKQKDEFDLNNLKPSELNWMLFNFDYVNYTPVLNNLYNFATNEYSNLYLESPIVSKYFYIPPFEQKPDTNNKVLEQPLSKLVSSNLQFAFANFLYNFGK